jgi:cell shape-determining protein MreC
MSLENIEEYLKDVQAIKYYDTVRAENEELKKKIEEAEEIFQLERDKLMETNSELTLEQDTYPKK